MKNYFFPLFILAILIGFGSLDLNAQFDDLYYDPSTDRPLVQTRASAGMNDYAYEEDYYAYDDESYEYYDDYDYYYTSRIRRFRRPAVMIGFYDPFFTDIAFYDPFFDAFYMDPFNRCYTSFYGGFGYFSYWNRWDRRRFYDPFWGFGGRPGFNGGFGNTFIVNNYYGHGFGYDPFFNSWGYAGVNHWNYNRYNNGWGGFFNPNQNQNNGNGYYYGSRYGGSTVASTRGIVRNPGSQRPERTAAPDYAGNIGKTGNDAKVSGTRSARTNAGAVADRAEANKETKRIPGSEAGAFRPGVRENADFTRETRDGSRTVAGSNDNGRGLTPERTITNKTITRPPRSNESYNTPSRSNTWNSRDRYSNSERRITTSSRNSDGYNRSSTSRRSMQSTGSTPSRSMSPSRSSAPSRSMSPTRSSAPSRSMSPTRSSAPSRSSSSMGSSRSSGSGSVGASRSSGGSSRSSGPTRSSSGRGN